MTTASVNERRARRVIALGAGAALATLVLGVAVAVVVSASRGPVGPFATPLDAVVVFASLAVGLVGVVVIAYGLAQLAQARRETVGKRGAR
ncbi:MAG: hypothetical protein M5U28_44005 [Sandaracinaceae bacterium]|nr:hypothetical protein [Sandaracinaceae bacterium]